MAELGECRSYPRSTGSWSQLLMKCYADLRAPLSSWFWLWFAGLVGILRMVLASLAVKSFCRESLVLDSVAYKRYKKVRSRERRGLICIVWFLRYMNIHDDGCYRSWRISMASCGGSPWLASSDGGLLNGWLVRLQL